MRCAEIVEDTDKRIEGYRAESLLAMCEVLAVPLDDARRATIAEADADALAAMLDALRRTRALP